jgi:hypothetical protein
LLLFLFKFHNFKKVSRILLLYFVFFTTVLFAQPAQLDKNKDSYNWMVGASWNFVSPTNDMGNVKGFQYPSRFFVDRHYYGGWSWEAAMAFGKFDTLSVRPDSLAQSTSFFSLDANVRYSFQKMLYPSQTFDPYFSYGLGVTNRSIFGTNVTGNIAVGMNLWVSGNLGIQVQSAAKFAFTSNILKSEKHYLQHTIGLAFRIPEGSITDNTFNKRRYKKIKIIKEKPNKKKKKKKEKQDNEG